MEEKDLSNFGSLFLHGKNKIKNEWPLTIGDREFKDKEEFLNYVQSLKNFDYVKYCGGEIWKDNRSFKDFKLTYQDLHITKRHFYSLIHIISGQVWPFCDTIFLCDDAENDEHILDWCFHGERIGWKAGDEFWLVYNWACERFEIRKADPEKWTPLDKYIINDDLELRFKFGYYIYQEKSIIPNDEIATIKYVQKLGINSFPDRIEINLNKFNLDEDLQDIHQIFRYYYTFVNKKNKEVRHVISPFIVNRSHFELLEAIEKRLTQFDGFRHYNLYNKDEVEDMEKVYQNVLRYSHELKFYQKEDKNLTIEELNNCDDEREDNE